MRRRLNTPSAEFIQKTNHEDREIRIVTHEQQTHDPSGRRPRINWALIGFLAIAAFFLLTEHRAHLLGVLPFLLLALCPLLHLFGHGGHGGESRKGGGYEH